MARTRVSTCARIRRLGALGLAAVALTACEAGKSVLFAPGDATITLSLSQPWVAAGKSATVTVTVVMADGTPVGDGTEVQLTATDGRFDEPRLRTEAGEARTTYHAGTNVSTAVLTAASGSARAELRVTVISAPAHRVRATADPEVLPPSGGTSEIVATVQAEDGSAVAGVPLQFDTTAGEITPARAVSDAKGEARATLETKTAATVRISLADTPAAELKVGVRKVTYTFSGSTSPATPMAGEPVTFSYTAKASDGRTPTGALKVDFGDGNEGRIEDFKGTASVVHTYRDGGTYTVVARLRESGGATLRETLSVKVESDDVDPPDPPDPPTTSGDDELDPGKVTWLHTNVSTWKVTSKITNVSISSTQLCISHTKSGAWPTVDGLEGNPWVFAQINGRWYGGTYEWLRPGQVCKALGVPKHYKSIPQAIGPHIKKPPLQSWRPRSGELVGFMISTPARFGPQGPRQERSNIVLVRWP